MLKIGVVNFGDLDFKIKRYRVILSLEAPN
jgi:hypothetical protein